MNKWLLTVVYLAVSVFLTRYIPFSSFFRNVDTMVHEFGHAAMALLLSGQVLRIELHADHSGITYFRVHSAWSQIPVGLAGYMGSALFAMLLFYLYHRGRQMLGLAILTAIAIVMVVLYVHSGFGLIWLLAFIALNLAVWRFAGAGVQRVYYLLLAFLTLEESAFSSLYLALAALQDPSRAGDAASLAQVTGIPALFWALAFAAVALYCVARALSYFFKPQNRRAPARTPFGSAGTFEKNR